jgi:hypothetical protein
MGFVATNSFGMQDMMTGRFGGLLEISSMVVSGIFVNLPLSSIIIPPENLQQKVSPDHKR